MKLTEKERLILFNQFDILEKLDNDSSNLDYYKRNKEILINGYESEYNVLIEYFANVSEEICSEVKDILAMFRTLYYSYSELKDKENINENAVKFQGFEKNEETKHYAFANWYITKDRYKEFFELEKSSPCNKLNYYRNMLSKYNIITKKKNQFVCLELTAEEIKEIIKY